jgi:chromosome partitioning protein
MHVAVCLLAKGRSVGVVDLDSRQKSITRFLQNRQRYLDSSGLDLVCPEHVTVTRSSAADRDRQRAEDQQSLMVALEHFADRFDILVLDCPGSHTYLSQLAHALADTLITPMNDSFIDLDLLGEVDPDNWQVERLSHYAEMVWDSRKFRSASEKPPMDWVVTRNRLATLDSKNNRRVDAALAVLQKRIMFRYVPGLMERVIYKELFPSGLTMMDLDAVKQFGELQVSHVAARSEVRSLVSALNLPG